MPRGNNESPRLSHGNLRDVVASYDNCDRPRRRNRSNSSDRCSRRSRRHRQTRSRSRERRNRDSRSPSHYNSVNNDRLQLTLDAILRNLGETDSNEVLSRDLSNNTRGNLVNYSDSNNSNAINVNNNDPRLVEGLSSHGGTVRSREVGSSELIEALKNLQPIRSNNYFVSNFDPTVNNIDTWCDEVDRARIANSWSDCECLSRVASCLKGDAGIWLSEWVTNDRTWSNFKKELKPLCPQRLDYVNILYDVMGTTSDKYTTYAEYARRTLLRLRVVDGLSDELRTLIVIRGIDDTQVRAAAANAHLTVDNIVSFLSIYVETVKNKSDTHNSGQSLKRSNQNVNTRNNARCFKCGLRGHFERFCRRSNVGVGQARNRNFTDRLQCTFCKKIGHIEKDCFVKDRSNAHNQRQVNLCRAHLKSSSQDVMTAVVEGIPMDVLIDSGALNVSLISSDVLRYLSSQPQSTHCVLKGISNREIIVTSFVTVTIELDEISIEADLMVVPSSCMNTSIIIGTDVLNRDGVVYIRTRDRQYISDSLNTNIINQISTIDSIKIDTSLEGIEYDSLLGVVRDYSGYFISGTATTTVKTGEMCIKLTSSEPVVYRPYKLSYYEKLKVRDIVADLLSKNIIKESQSEYASPIILVKKKDGSNRMCVDFRALNRLTIRDRYPLPLINDHIDRLGSYKYFTSLDMATGFYQIPINGGCTHYTGFVTPEGHYEFLKMPFGLTNSPVVYQRIINNTLREFIDSGHVLVYIDDVCIMSSSIDEGIALLQQVLRTLTVAGFSINLNKCSFLKTEIEYLGRLVSEGQVKPSPRKIEALTRSSPPQNVRQVRQLLGLAGYFRKYIRNYGVKTASLTYLTRKDVKFNWGPEQEQVRIDLIQTLTNAPVLAIFNPKFKTELHTDASSAGYGAILLQIHADDSRHVVEYFSKVTQNAEPKYHSYELETLAVVRALQHFRHYLIGLKFKLVTDCNALKSTERKKDLLPRVARWWLYLQDFDFVIEYRQGVMMPHVDYLSRNPPVIVNQISRPRNWAQIAQSADDEVRSLMVKLQEGQLDSNRYVVRNGLLCYKYSHRGEKTKLLCFIPKGHRLSLLRLFHDEHQHINAEKTLELIRRHFWFPGMLSFVRKYIAHCIICVSKKRVPRQPLQQIISWQKPSEPFNTIHVDTLGPLPTSKDYKFILIVVDSFTKFCLLYRMQRQDTLELKASLSNTVALFGAPKLVITDRGRMFESREFSSWIQELGSSIHYVIPEMHHANGQVERYVRTLLNMLRVEVDLNPTWSDTLWKLQLTLNITRQKTTQSSPLKLLIGTDGATPLIRSVIRDLAIDETRPDREAWREMCRARASELLDRNQQKQDDRVNRNRQVPRQYSVGDFAFVIKYSQSIGRLDPGMRGPYRITKVLPGGRYELKLIAGGYGKTAQAASQYMVPWRGEWCPESCASFFNYDEDEEQQDNSTAGSSQASSMPPLDCDDLSAPEINTEACSSNVVEDDSTSGEAE